jgi:hypothetical protein
MRQELLEVILDAHADLRNACRDTHNLWIGFLKVASHESLNDHFANLNRVGFTNLWLIFYGLKDKANGLNAAGSQLLLLLCLPFHSLENTLKPRHKLVVMCLEVGVENTCKATQG